MSQQAELKSQRIYADRAQFRIGNGRFSFSGTVHLETQEAGHVLRDGQQIPVQLSGKRWYVRKEWSTPQLSLFA